MKVGYRLTIYAVITLLIGGFFTVNASASSMPGDPLYGVKRGLENARLALALRENSRAELEETFEQTRVEEVKTLLAEGESQEVEFTGEILAKEGPVWNIGGFTVRVGPGTELEGDLQVGTEVEVEAFTQEDGSLLAVEIQEADQDLDDELMETDEPEDEDPLETPEPTDLDDDSDDDYDDDSDDDYDDDSDDDYDDDSDGDYDDDSDDDYDDDYDDDADDDLDEVTAFGYLEAFSESTMTVNGLTYLIGEDFDWDDELALGDYVEVEYYQNQAGEWILTDLDREDPQEETRYGTVEEIGDDYLVIDGMTYYFGEDLDLDEELSVGDTVEFDFYQDYGGDLMLVDVDLDSDTDMDDDSEDDYDEDDDEDHDDEDHDDD